MVEYVTSLCLFSGALFMLLAAIGILRFPDLFTRMHASTKSVSLGAVLILTGVAVHSQGFWVILGVVIIIIFIFMTAPTASHMIGRAAYSLRVPMWQGTRVDELREHYDRDAGTLERGLKDS